MNNKIKFIALSALASAMAFTSVASQAAVNGSVEVKFQSSITSASCDIGVIDENGNNNLSNTVILPSLTSTEVGTTEGLVGTSVPFSIGPVDPEACFDSGAVTTYDISASADEVDADNDVLRNDYTSGPANMGVQIVLDSGASILDTPLLAQTVATAQDTVVKLKAQLFHLDTTAPSAGLIGSRATFTTAYY
jgi:type 1 fimbria pilin